MARRFQRQCLDKIAAGSDEDDDGWRAWSFQKGVSAVCKVLGGRLRKKTTLASAAAARCSSRSRVEEPVLVRSKNAQVRTNGRIDDLLLNDGRWSRRRD